VTLLLWYYCDIIFSTKSKCMLVSTSYFYTKRLWRFQYHRELQSSNGIVLSTDDFNLD